MGDLEPELQALRAEKKATDLRRAYLLRAAIVSAILRHDRKAERERRAELAALEATEQSE